MTRFAIIIVIGLLGTLLLCSMTKAMHGMVERKAQANAIVNAIE